MDRRIEALRAIDQAVRDTVPIEPVTLSREYLESIRRVEELPENQDGADKSWMGRRWSIIRRHLATASELDRRD